MAVNIKCVAERLLARRKAMEADYFKASDVRAGMLVEIEEQMLGVQVILKDKNRDLWFVGVPYEWDYRGLGLVKIAGGPKTYLRKPDEPVQFLQNEDPLGLKFFDRDCVVLSVGG